MERDGRLPRFVLAQPTPFRDLFAVESGGRHRHVAAQRQKPKPAKEPASLAFVANPDGVFIGGNRRDDHRLAAVLAHESLRRPIATPQVVVEVDQERRVEQEHQLANCFRRA